MHIKRVWWRSVFSMRLHEHVARTWSVFQVCLGGLNFLYFFFLFSHPLQSLSFPKYFLFPKIKYSFFCSKQLLLYRGLIGVMFRAGEYEGFARFWVNFSSLVDLKLQPSQVFLPFLSLPLFRSCAIPVFCFETLSPIDGFPTLLKRHKEAWEDVTQRIVFLLKQGLENSQ